jgi:hypothetical protein
VHVWYLEGHTPITYTYTHGLPFLTHLHTHRERERETERKREKKKGRDTQLPCTTRDVYPPKYIHPSTRTYVRTYILVGKATRLSLSHRQSHVGRGICPRHQVLHTFSCSSGRRGLKEFKRIRNREISRAQKVHPWFALG